MEVNALQFTVKVIEDKLYEYYILHSHAPARFLELAQASHEAWSFAWELLDPTKPFIVQFFAAETLHVKISKDWNDVTDELYAPLRDRLVGALISYVAKPNISTKLCRAMSSFIIQSIISFKPTAVADVISAFQPQNIQNANPEQIERQLLEVLKNLPEFQTTRIAQGHAGIIRNALRSSLLLVMELVQDVLSKTSSPAELCEISLKCYSSWSMLGSAVLEYKSLLLLTFDSVYREDIRQTALETLSKIANHPDYVKHPNLAMEMIKHIMKFREILQRAIQEDDRDKCNSVYALIIAVAENNCELILDTIRSKPDKKHLTLELVNLILQCSSTPGQFPTEETCSEQAFGFWYTLQKAICPTENIGNSYFEDFQGIFRCLLIALTRKLKYPSDGIYQDWTYEIKESFRCYQQDIFDSVIYCINVLREEGLELVQYELIRGITGAEQDFKSNLILLKRILDMYNGNEFNKNFRSSFVSTLKSVILSACIDNKVAAAKLEVIGSAIHWINIKRWIKLETTTSCLLKLLSVCLQTKEFNPAVFCIKALSRFITPSHFAEEILKLCMRPMHELILNDEEEFQVICIMSKVLSKMSLSCITEYLGDLLPTLFTNLRRCLNYLESDLSFYSASIVLKLGEIEMLYVTLQHHLDKDTQQFGILRNIVFLFSDTDNWISHLNIIQALIETVKKFLSMDPTEYQVYLPSLQTVMLKIIKNHAQPVFDFFQHILLIYSNNEEVQGILSHFFVQICNDAIPSLRRDLKENIGPFSKMLEYVMKRAINFFNTEAVDSLTLFQFGLAALNLPRKSTIKAAAGFLTEFITHSREVPSMLNVVNNQGEILVMQVMKVIGGDSPRSVVEFMPDILLALNKKYFDNLCRWLIPFTQQEGFPSFRASQCQKEEFMRQILKERTNKRKLKEIVTEFSLLCRGLIGTEYAAQTSQSLP